MPSAAKKEICVEYKRSKYSILIPYCIHISIFMSLVMKERGLQPYTDDVSSGFLQYLIGSYTVHLLVNVNLSGCSLVLRYTVPISLMAFFLSLDNSDSLLERSSRTNVDSVASDQPCNGFSII